MLAAAITITSDTGGQHHPTHSAFQDVGQKVMAGWLNLGGRCQARSGNDATSTRSGHFMRRTCERHSNIEISALRRFDRFSAQ